VRSHQKTIFPAGATPYLPVWTAGGYAGFELFSPAERMPKGGRGQSIFETYLVLCEISFSIIRYDEVLSSESVKIASNPPTVISKERYTMMSVAHDVVGSVMCQQLTILEQLLHLFVR
jgi:hypothetical protein